MKMKKFCNLSLMIVVSLFLTSGCAGMRDKFVRKPKEKDETAKTYQSIRKYDVRPSLELYTKRYIFWKSWHRELLGVLDAENHKKTVTAIEQEISNLMDMRSMLVDEKANELKLIIDEMDDIEMTIKKQRVTGGNGVNLRRRLEAIGRDIQRDFTYNKIPEFIRSEFVKK
ncbi:MAG: hypothetical protein ABH844_05485 [Candidatus Omnitrophota bacterium]